MEFPVTTNLLLAWSSPGGDGESEPPQSSGKGSRGALCMGSSGDEIWPEEREGGTRKNSIAGWGNLIRRRRNQHNALTIAGQACKASVRGRIEAIREKTVSIFPFFLAVEIWPLRHFCQRRGSWFQRPHKVKWWKFYLFIYLTEFNWDKADFIRKEIENLFFSCLLFLSHTQTTPPHVPSLCFFEWEGEILFRPVYWLRTVSTDAFTALWELNKCL